MSKFVAGFDFDGTLIPDKNEDKNFNAIKAIYNTLLDSEDWIVYIISSGGNDRIEKQLKQFGLRLPDKILGSNEKVKKLNHIRKVKPDILFDDAISFLRHVLENGGAAMYSMGGRDMDLIKKVGK